MSAVSARPAAPAERSAAFADLARLLHAASSPQATLELVYPSGGVRGARRAAGLHHHD